MRSRTARSIVRVIGLALCAGGMWISYHLTLKHHEQPQQAQQAKQEKSVLDDVCHATAASSCEEVIKSEWGSIKLGAGAGAANLPTAQLGLYYFTFVFCWLAAIGDPSPSRWWVHLIFVIGTLNGLGVAVFLFIVMMTQLEHWCPLCTLTHALSLALVICGVLMWPRVSRPASAPAERDAKPAPQSASLFYAAAKPGEHDVESWPDLHTVVFTLLLVGLALGAETYFLKANAGVLAVEQHKKNFEYYQKQYNSWVTHFSENWEATVVDWNLSPPFPINYDDYAILGQPNAVHTVVFYSDLQCPACQKFDNWFLNTILARFGPAGRVRMIFKHWPLCSQCNEHSENNLHPAACRTALATEAARLVGGPRAFWNMQHALFTHQEAIRKLEKENGLGAVDEYIVKLAREELKLDEAKFIAARDGDEAIARVRADIEEGEKLGKGIVPDEQQFWYKINSTPTVYVDGKRLFNPRHIQSWHNIMAAPRGGPASLELQPPPFVPQPAMTRPSAPPPATQPR